MPLPTFCFRRGLGAQSDWAAGTRAGPARRPGRECRIPLNIADFTFKQYPAKEQAELKVRIKVPGSWFNGLQGAERACM